MAVCSPVDVREHDLSAHAGGLIGKSEIEYLNRQRVVAENMKTVVKFFDLRDRLNVFEQIAADEVKGRVRVRLSGRAVIDHLPG